jgi:ferredoxin-type protein NapG
MDSNRPVDRRRFFREGLRELLKPLANAIEPLHEAAKQLEQMEQLTGAAASPTGIGASPRRMPLDVWLRPPGALAEQSFLDTCSRCGECVRVCPAQCIKLDPSASAGRGAPYIVADEMPCVVCDGLQCMYHCPTGALQPIPLGQIRMGTAVWHPDTCVRSRGEACTICVDRCPVGSVAIALVDDRIEVKPLGCIGCGVCQHDCPTDPKSIVVIPIAAKQT